MQIENIFALLQGDKFSFKLQMYIQQTEKTADERRHFHWAKSELEIKCEFYF